MAGIDEINVNFDSDDKKISISDNTTSGEANIDIKNDDTLYGVDLLANKNYNSGNSDNGYSSGEESTKKNEDYDFFKDKIAASPDVNIFERNLLLIFIFFIKNSLTSLTGLGAFDKKVNFFLFL